MKKKNIEKLIRTVPNFPKEGIMFRDITPIFYNPKAVKSTCKKLLNDISDIDYDTIVGMESRGFLFGTMMAANSNSSFVLGRKAGKLPCEKVSKSYQLEYGTATVELHVDSIKKGQKVIIFDDLLATGGTSIACAELVEELGGEVVGFSYLIELADLGGRKNIAEKYNVPIQSLFEY